MTLLLMYPDVPNLNYLVIPYCTVLCILLVLWISIFVIVKSLDSNKYSLVVLRRSGLCWFCYEYLSRSLVFLDTHSKYTWNLHSFLKTFPSIFKFSLSTTKVFRFFEALNILNSVYSCGLVSRIACVVYISRNGHLTNRK